MITGERRSPDVFLRSRTSDESHDYNRRNHYTIVELLEGETVGRHGLVAAMGLVVALLFLLPGAGVLALQPHQVKTALLLDDISGAPAKVVVEHKTPGHGASLAAASARRVIQSPDATAAPATTTGVWHLFHNTTQHEKAPGGGYVYGSPL